MRWLWKNGPSSQPIDEPLEALEDGGDRCVGRALAVGVLDPQDEGAAVMAGVEEVEERGAGAADVEVAARARGEAGAGGVGSRHCDKPISAAGEDGIIGGLNGCVTGAELSAPDIRTISVRLMLRPAVFMTGCACTLGVVSAFSR